MIVNPGSGASSDRIKIVACGTFVGVRGDTLTLPQRASMVIIGEYTYNAMSGATPSCKAAFLLTPGMSTSGLSPEMNFKEDAVTLEMGSAMNAATVTRNYIAIA